jgi:hypothetical protein
VVVDPVRDCRSFDGSSAYETLPPGEVFPFIHAGNPRSAIAGRIEVHGDDGSHDDATEFVRDDVGGVWSVVRTQRITSSARHDVDACQWGCWGSPGGGAAPPPARCARGAWLVPDGHAYRGEIEIAYDATVVEFNYLQQGCPTPP